MYIWLPTNSVEQWNHIIMIKAQKGTQFNCFLSSADIVQVLGGFKFLVSSLVVSSQ